MAGTAMNLAESGEGATAGQVLLLFAASVLASVAVTLCFSAQNTLNIVIIAMRVSLLMSVLFGSFALLFIHSRGLLTKASGVANCPPLFAEAAAGVLIAILAALFGATFVPTVRRWMDRNEAAPTSTQD